ncbi:hypothetical protein L1049_013603 [Liquidambar formosana]|uniref:Uncharacterized protein n=1 Tax=Liquidambar formosana TaxID=63359 RepID=A0AAP0RNW4_LIQFO
MELGYSGVAYNRTIKGVMSDADYCSISPLSLSSLLKLAPSLSSSVKLHRDLLGVPMSSPFRQYKRLTVTVDSAAQATSLNSGNPVLKTYDLVAVRPMNQNAFDQACQTSEVDIITIDFSEKLPFRLKLPLVKAAIQRGIYFEIMYSSLIADVQTRRQMISNAKLLVDWTRGKNLIFSSAAPSVNELRGPNDVANLASLLGMSMERAKAAISKNCRTLIVNALTKKKCYKGAIRVEVMSSGEQFDSKEPWFGDGLKWDPISSGEGDLLLDDMAKSFSASSKVCKTVKAIDFASIMDSIPSHGLQFKVPSHGLQVKELISGTQAVLQPPDNGKNHISAAEVIEVSMATNGASEQPETDQTSLNDTPATYQTSGCEDSKKDFSPDSSSKDFANAEEIGTRTTTSEEEPKSLTGLDVYFAPIETETHDFQLQNCISSCEPNVVLPDENIIFHKTVREMEFDAASDDTSTPFRNHSAFQNEETERSKGFDVILGAKNVVVDEVLSELNVTNQADSSLASTNVCLHSNSLEREEIRELRDDEVLLADGKPSVEHCDEIEGKNDYLVANHEQLKDVIMEDQKQGEDHTEINYPSWDESISGKRRAKQRTPHRSFLFPFKPLLNPIPFKKKARKFKNKIKMV